MITDPWFYALAIPAIILTGLSKGGFLGAAGGLAVPMMSLVISPVQAAGIMLPILNTMDVTGLIAYRREFRLEEPQNSPACRSTRHFTRMGNGSLRFRSARSPHRRHRRPCFHAELLAERRRQAPAEFAQPR